MRPFPRTDSSHGLCDGYAERGEAVQHGDADLKLCDLTVKVPRAQALAELLHAMHLCFDAASAVIPAPSSPDGPSDALRCPQDFVAGDRAGGVGFPGFSVLSGRDDRGSAAGSDGIMTFARVKSAIRGDAADLLLGRDLVEQFGQHGGITYVAGGELRSLDLQCFLVDPDVDLAPHAPFRAAMFACIPLPFGAPSFPQSSRKLVTIGKQIR